MSETSQFDGQLLLESEPFSLEQLPRLRVYGITQGQLVVHRTWPPFFGQDSSFTVYSDLESLVDDPLALSTLWITETDPLGEHTDLTPELIVSLGKAVAQSSVVALDDLKSHRSPECGAHT